MVILCGLGSFYILILMAAASKMRPQIRMWTGEIAGRIAKVIRDPVVGGEFFSLTFFKD